MAEQRRIRKTKEAARNKETSEASAAEPQEKGSDLKAELDELLDEIDGVLEENAETFVAQYIQKGGQ